MTNQKDIPDKRVKLKEANRRHYEYYKSLYEQGKLSEDDKLQWYIAQSNKQLD